MQLKSSSISKNVSNFVKKEFWHFYTEFLFIPSIQVYGQLKRSKYFKFPTFFFTQKTKNSVQKITKYFDMIIKYTNDVVNSENEAVKAAKQMEEASLKALFSRKNMVNVK